VASHLVRSPWFTVLAAAFVLEGCGEPPPARLARLVQPVAELSTVTDQAPFRDAAHYEQRTTEGSSARSAPALDQLQTQDPPPWLTELLHSPDPNTRVQGLDAWARHPGASLDPVTYALVDPDEAVRARAQELYEEELARR
jgi:hypothetical protein